MLDFHSINTFIILLADLQTIPEELYEDAKVDGADAWQQFKYIAVPMLIFIFVIVTNCCHLKFNAAIDLVYSMTRD